MKQVMLTAVLVIISIMMISQVTFSQNNRTKSDKNNIGFPQKAYSGGMMEVKLGKLAQQKAGSDKVKQFGERMIADHSKANEELKDVAQKNNITLPDSMLDENKDIYEGLNNYKGSDFDKKYMTQMVADHKEVIKAFEDAAKNAENPEVRRWAEKTLPTLNQHLQLAQETLKSLNNNK